MPPKFSFSSKVHKFLNRSQKDKYPREQAWEFLWDYVQDFDTWRELISDEIIEHTGLHIGFYLANWGMFRPNGSLLNKNLQFFMDLAEFLFLEISEEFWDLTLRDFNPNDDKNSKKAQLLYDEAYKKIETFGPNPNDIWTPTLVTKLLMGIWGQCPARDTNFSKGISLYLKIHPNINLRGRTRIKGQFLSDMSELVYKNNWDISGYKTIKGKNPYPAGKVIDMAFYQFGADNKKK